VHPPPPPFSLIRPPPLSKNLTLSGPSILIISPHSPSFIPRRADCFAWQRSHSPWTGTGDAVGAVTAAGYRPAYHSCEHVSRARVDPRPDIFLRDYEAAVVRADYVERVHLHTYTYRVPYCPPMIRESFVPWRHKRAVWSLRTTDKHGATTRRPYLVWSCPKIKQCAEGMNLPGT